MDTTSDRAQRKCAFCDKGIEGEESCVTINGVHYHSRCFDRRDRQPKPTG